MAKSRNQSCTQHTENGVIVLTFNEPILNADAVTEALRVIKAEDNRKVILDFQTVRFLVGGSLCPDQEPLTPILKLGKQLNEKGGRLVLCNVAPEIAEVLRVIRFDRIIDIRPDVKLAIEFLARPTESTTSRYSHTQKSPLCFILYTAALGCLILAWRVDDTPGFYIAGGAGLLIASLAPAFHHITVVGLDELLVIRFGPVPLFRKTVQYTDIVSVQVGRTLLLDGLGIHMSIRGGWVWNIWGRDCVVVHFRNDSVFRIGTDDAENLAAFLQSRVVT